MFEIGEQWAAASTSGKRADELFRAHRDAIFRETDGLFAKLMIGQWIAAVVIALLFSPRTWEGTASQIHLHVWAAVFLGGAISIFPAWMARVWPGAAVTRHVFAVAQMLMSGLLIGLSGGRIETHFHVFGSLVILSFYRDWKVFIPATLVVALDHFIRGIYWPYSVYGVLSASPWRSFEHAGWVVFENLFLMISCLRSVNEMRFIANRTAALEDSERSGRLVFEQAPIGMAMMGLNVRFQQVNKTLCEMLGYEEHELVARNPLDLTYPEDLEKSEASARSMLEGKAKTSLEKRYVRKDGSVLWVTRTACAIRDESGTAHHYLIMVEDISERKQSEDGLRESKRQLEGAIKANQLIMDNSQDVICTLDAEGRFVSVNAACEALWGYTAEELAGRRQIEFVHPDDRSLTDATTTKVFQTGKLADFVNRHVRRDETVVDVLWSISWLESEQLMFCVAHDVTARARIEKELRDAKEDADRANCAKNEFLSRMSHELRTPLNAILGFGQLLERQNPTEVQRTRVRYIINAGRHLLSLINEVLDISRIEAGNLQLSLEPVAIGEVLQEALDLMRPMATERSIELVVATELERDCHVQADRQRFKQVLLNLLTNAVKYTPAGGRVTVSDGRCGENTVRIAVSDSGAGIPADKLSRLFTPFDRLGAEQSAVEGAGLGLALCQRLVHAMRGSIGVNGNGGVGSTFWVELPTAESPLSRLASAKVPNELAFAAERPQRRILYIEDNLSNLSLIEQMLADQPQIALITAMQGQLGLDLARQHCPDLILLDLHLPDIPGWDVLARLRKDPATGKTPVVVISADATPRQVERLMNAGANYYLTKPLDMEEFYRVIDETNGVEKPAEEPVAA
ncbi:MAG: PAS domain S-box protein [Chthoniobacterales bacterium]